MTKNRKIECRCQCHHKHECYFGKTPCVKCGHDFASSTPEPSEEWREEFKKKFTKNGYLVPNQMKFMRAFIFTLLAQREKELIERIESQIDGMSLVSDNALLVRADLVELLHEILATLSEAGEKGEEVEK